MLDFICVTIPDSFHCVFRIPDFKGLNTCYFIEFMNTEYLVAERVLTQAEVLNTEMLALAIAEYSSRPRIIYSG